MRFHRELTSLAENIVVVVFINRFLDARLMCFVHVTTWTLGAQIESKRWGFFKFISYTVCFKRVENSEH